MKTVTVKLPHELDSRLEHLAKAIKKNKSVVIRLALEELLKQPEILSKLSAYELVGDYAGVLDRLPPDLSTNKRHFRGYGS